ncbi:MAG: hypothetical protein SynsKO_08290 [Synoicihabitans sp.]
MTRRQAPYLFIRILSFLCAITYDAHANNVVEESFTDGALVGGSDSLDIDWYAGSAANIAIINDSGGLQGGNALQYLSTGTFSRATASFPSPISLADSGDLLVVTLKLRMTRFDPANDGALRFGLHDNRGTDISAANQSAGWGTNTAGWEGYFFRGGVGGESGMWIFRDVVSADNSAMGGNGDIAIGSGNGWSVNDDAAHTVRIEIERQSNAQNTLRFYWDGTLQQETTTAMIGGALSTFTNFTLGTGSSQVDLLIDDVTVAQTTAGGSGSIPIDLSARLIDWTRAGVEGAIPDYANTINFVGAGGNNQGTGNNSPLLQSLIDGLTGDTVIFFPAGTYRFERRINFQSTASRDLPGVIIRGAGTDQTKLVFADPVAEDAGLFDVAGFNSGSAKSISGGLTKGSVALTLSSTSGLNIGDWLWIRQDNDPVAMATTRNIPDYESTINNSTGWAARSVGQLVKISGVTNDSVTLEQPLHLDFTWPNPTAQRLGTVSGVGFENFTLDNALGTAGRFNFDFTRAVNCWVKNVHSLMAMRSHVAISGSANIDIRDSYFNDAYRHDGGGHGYGAQVLDTATHCLIENNVFRNLRHAMIWKEGANGNVYAYNYSTDGNQDGSPIAKDISGHGHYAFANLIEGNIAQFIHASDYWGPIGPHNTFLRNRTTEERILIEDGTKDQNVIGNELVSTTSPFVVVDGTSTGAFVHGNNEGGSLQWRNGEAQSVVASYFYSTTPAFWNISDPWPAMGPEYAPGTHTIPAKHRWDTRQMQEFTAAAGTGRLSNLSTRGQVLTGNNILIAGFVVSGTTNQRLLLRGIGPALDEFLDPATVLDDPLLTVYRGNEAILTNDNWSEQSESATVASVTSSVGGFALADGSRDAALVADLSPGPYSMHVSGNGGTGIALVEIYDADTGTNAQLLNISTRGRVGSGATVMVPGIVVTESNRRLLIRGVGPELATSFGFAANSVLPDPVLTLINAEGETVATNDDWDDGTTGSPAEIISTAETLGAFPLRGASADAALLITLPPGVYTAQVTDASGAEGIAIVEVYAVTE